MSSQVPKRQVNNFEVKLSLETGNSGYKSYSPVVIALYPFQP